MIARITKNEIRYLRSLSIKKFRNGEQKFVLEGLRAVEEAFLASAEIEYIVIEKSRVEEISAILDSTLKKRIPVKVISAVEMKQISSTVHSQGILALVRMKKYSIEDIVETEKGFLIALDAVSDPGNIGTIIRTADWFGAVGILLSDGCVDVHNEKVLRSTVGSIFHIPVVENVSLPNAFKTLRDNGYKIIALAGDGEQSIFEVKFGEKNVLVLGSEARGINQEVRQSCDSIFKIPKFGKAESLNVSIACGIGCAMMRM